jgi:hypothetical protein
LQAFAPPVENLSLLFYDILLIGETSDGRSLRVSVKGDTDPSAAEHD